MWILRMMCFLLGMILGSKLLFYSVSIESLVYHQHQKARLVSCCKFIADIVLETLLASKISLSDLLYYSMIMQHSMYGESEQLCLLTKVLFFHPEMELQGICWLCQVHQNPITL